MTTTIPGIEAYPKTILLRDSTELKLRTLIEEDKLRLLDFSEGFPRRSGTI